MNEQLFHSCFVLHAFILLVQWRLQTLVALAVWWLSSGACSHHTGVVAAANGHSLCMRGQTTTAANTLNGNQKGCLLVSEWFTWERSVISMIHLIKAVGNDLPKKTKDSHQHDSPDKGSQHDSPKKTKDSHQHDLPDKGSQHDSPKKTKDSHQHDLPDKGSQHDSPKKTKDSHQHDKWWFTWKRQPSAWFAWKNKMVISMICLKKRQPSSDEKGQWQSSVWFTRERSVTVISMIHQRKVSDSCQHDSPDKG